VRSLAAKARDDTDGATTLPVFLLVRRFLPL
jgi:hypothetical protein